MHKRFPTTFAATNLTVILGGGTLLFHALEDWSLIDSFYYTGMTITTVGTYEPMPENDLTKIVAVFFALYGITLALYCLGIMRPKIDDVLTKAFDKIIFWKKID